MHHADQGRRVGGIPKIVVNLFEESGVKHLMEGQQSTRRDAVGHIDGRSENIKILQRRHEIGKYFKTLFKERLLIIRDDPGEGGICVKGRFPVRSVNGGSLRIIIKDQLIHSAEKVVPGGTGILKRLPKSGIGVLYFGGEDDFFELGRSQGRIERAQDTRRGSIRHADDRLAGQKHPRFKGLHLKLIGRLHCLHCILRHQV